MNQRGSKTSVMTKTRIKGKVYHLGKIKGRIILIPGKKKFHKHTGNNYRGYQANNYKIFKPQDSVIKEPAIILNKNPA